MKIMLDVDSEVNFTKEWWVGILKDEPRLHRWLQKLEVTEIGGFEDYEKYMHRFSLTEKNKAIFTHIAEDERKHSGILLDLFSSRKIERVFGTPENEAVKSSYWTSMNYFITTVETCCAVNYFGEALAAFRFEVLHSMKETPSDIKEALGIILPDEQFHRETLKRLSGDEALEKLYPIHMSSMAVLKGQK